MLIVAVISLMDQNLADAGTSYLKDAAEDGIILLVSSLSILMQGMFAPISALSRSGLRP